MRRPYQRCHPVRDEDARKKWRLKKSNRCQACGGRPDFRGLHVHHLERFMRSDEPCNLLLLDARCHGMTHDEPTQDGRLTQGMLVLVKWLEDPDEFCIERLSELKGSPVEFEDLPEWLWILRKRKRMSTKPKTDEHASIERFQLTGIRCINACEADSEYKIRMVRMSFNLCGECMRRIVDGYHNMQMDSREQVQPVPGVRET